MTDTQKPPVKLCFMDTETTGLDRRVHEVWEIAIVTANHTETGLEILTRNNWMLEPTTGLGDPMAYKINKFYEREKLWNARWKTAYEIAHIVADSHLVAAVPDFDAFWVEDFLREHNQVPTWHYHLIDIENLIAGRFGVVPPYMSEDLFEMVGLPKEYPGKHTAIGDVEQLVRCWKALYFSGETT